MARGDRIIIQRPVVRPAGFKDQKRAAFTPVALGRSIQRSHDASVAREAVEVDAHEILQRPALLLRVEPSERETRIRAELPGDKSAARTEPMIQRQLSDAIAVVRLELVFAGVATE